MSKNNIIVCVSGYFDPVHKGHLEYFKNAKKAIIDMEMYPPSIIKLLVIVNNDTQAALKKGKAFMPCDERILLIQEFKCVDIVVKSIDETRDICETLREISKDPKTKPTYFCNGGDQFNDIIPEKPVCEELGIVLIDGLGNKVQSSSWLLKNAKDIQKK